MKNVQKTASFSAQLIPQFVLQMMMQHVDVVIIMLMSEPEDVFWMKSCQIVFDAPLCCGAPSLPSRRRGAVWLWHFTLAQQSRPVTIRRLYNQLLPQPLAPCCWANYEYSVAMKVILSDMQLSSRIVSVVLFVVFEGSISQGRDRSNLQILDMYDDKTECKMT